MQGKGRGKRNCPYRKRSCFCHKRKLAPREPSTVMKTMPNGDAEVRTSGCWNLWKNIAKQDPSFGHPEKFCSDINKTNWESATITTLDAKIIPYITNICKRDPRTGKVVTGGIVSCKDSKWLLSWTINRQGQFNSRIQIRSAYGYTDCLRTFPATMLKNR